MTTELIITIFNGGKEVDHGINFVHVSKNESTGFGSREIRGMVEGENLDTQKIHTDLAERLGMAYGNIVVITGEEEWLNSQTDSTLNDDYKYEDE